jgi:hypothetical protein
MFITNVPTGRLLDRIDIASPTELRVCREGGRVGRHDTGQALVRYE